MSLFQSPITVYFQNHSPIVCLCCQSTGISITLKTSSVQSIQSELVTICGCTSKEKCEFVLLWVTPPFISNLAVRFSPQLPTDLLGAGGHSVISHLRIPARGFPHTSFNVKVGCPLTAPLIQFNDLITCQFACCQKLVYTHACTYIFHWNICVCRFL